MVSVVQQWNPDDWEAFAQALLQWRHGVLNVHKIPSTHSGDLGIDYYCVADAVIYQCYAVEEPLHVGVRAERQKRKINDDLKKLLVGASDVAKLLLGKQLKNWVLLVPLQNSKDVTLHCAKKSVELRAQNIPLLAPDFEVCVHDQGQWPRQVLQNLFSTSSELVLDVDMPSAEELALWEAGSPDLLANASAKLAKRIKGDAVGEAVAESVKSFLRGNALVDALRTSAPDLHEKIAAAIQRRARILALAGPKGGPTPSAILHAELENLTMAIQGSAPSLSENNAQDIALGTISEWIMRCPLDFPSNVK